MSFISSLEFRVKNGLLEVKAARTLGELAVAQARLLEDIEILKDYCQTVGGSPSKEMSQLIQTIEIELLDRAKYIEEAHFHGERII